MMGSSSDKAYSISERTLLDAFKKFAELNDSEIESIDSDYVEYHARYPFGKYKSDGSEKKDEEIIAEIEAKIAEEMSFEEILSYDAEYNEVSRNPTREETNGFKILEECTKKRQKEFKPSEAFLAFDKLTQAFEDYVESKLRRKNNSENVIVTIDDRMEFGEEFFDKLPDDLLLYHDKVHKRVKSFKRKQTELEADIYHQRMIMFDSAELNMNLHKRIYVKAVKDFNEWLETHKTEHDEDTKKKKVKELGALLDKYEGVIKKELDDRLKLFFESKPLQHSKLKLQFMFQLYEAAHPIDTQTSKRIKNEEFYAKSYTKLDSMQQAEFDNFVQIFEKLESLNRLSAEIGLVQEMREAFDLYKEGHEGKIKSSPATTDDIAAGVANFLSDVLSFKKLQQFKFFMDDLTDCYQGGFGKNKYEFVSFKAGAQYVVSGSENKLIGQARGSDGSYSNSDKELMLKLAPQQYIDVILEGVNGNSLNTAELLNVFRCMQVTKIIPDSLENPQFTSQAKALYAALFEIDNTGLRSSKGNKIRNTIFNIFKEIDSFDSADLIKAEFSFDDYEKAKQAIKSVYPDARFSIMRRIGRKFNEGFAYIKKNPWKVLGGLAVGAGFGALCVFSFGVVGVAAAGGVAALGAVTGGGAMLGVGIVVSGFYDRNKKSVLAGTAITGILLGGILVAPLLVAGATAVNIFTAIGTIGGLASAGTPAIGVGVCALPLLPAVWSLVKGSALGVFKSCRSLWNTNPAPAIRVQEKPVVAPDRNVDQPVSTAKARSRANSTLTIDVGLINKGSRSDDKSASPPYTGTTVGDNLWSVGSPLSESDIEPTEDSPDNSPKPKDRGLR